MKELTIQEKAEAYDNALKVLHKYDGANIMFSQSLKEEMFPELHELDDESDDERIRKALINEFIYLQSKGWKFAGLEGEDIIAWLNRQCDQNLTNKIVFKFHEDDWCIDNEDGTIFQIVKILDNTYTYKTIEGKEYSCTHYSLENDARLWNINDAKPGDVLVDEDNNIGIFKECEGIYWDSYIYLGCDGKLRGFSIGGSHVQNNTHPATKEQRDTLMKALTDAGWEFDFDKKKLNKIEQKSTDKVKPKFHEGEWIITNKKHIWYVDETPKTTSYLYRLINQYGKVEVAEFEVVDEKAKLWTIEDAKPGDVLVLYDGRNACIFRKKMEDDDAIWVDAYCGINSDGMFNVNDEDECWCLICDCVPATKEQRDLLFQKMRESGYEWDDIKKELKTKYTHELDNSYSHVTFPFEAKVKSSGKIVTIHGGQLSQGGKEWIKYQSDVKDGYKVYEPNDLELVYEIDQKQVIDYPDNLPKDNWELIHELVNKFGRIPKDEDELNVFIEYVLKRQRSAWSKEDSMYYDDICEILINLIHGNDDCINKDVVQKDLDWFTSLIEKNIWKPTDEQMEILQYLCETSSHPNEKVIPILESLLSDLKKLRKE